MIKNHRLIRIITILVACGVFLLYLGGVASIPFHPDEATYIFMASDFNQFIQNPLELSFQPDLPDSTRQRYRLIDGPLIRYIIGFGLNISDQEPLNVDWDWSKTWQENEANGAVPDARVLLASRLSVSTIFGISLFLAYQVSRRLHGRFAGLAAMLLLGSNALVLLHTRRAMAESLAVLSVYLILWLIPKAGRYPFLVGLAAGLALCAKQSTLPTIGIAALSILYFSGSNSQGLWKFRLINLGIFGVGAFLVFSVLNPVFWAHPLQAFSQALEQRQDLLVRQLADWGNYGLLNRPLPSLFIFFGNVFFTQPAIAEAINYIQATAAAQTAYFANPFNQLFRGFGGGSVLLILFFVGVYINLRTASRLADTEKKMTILYLGGTLLQCLFILVLMPIPWQRYVLPVLPYVFLWTASAVSTFSAMLTKKLLPEISFGEQPVDQAS